LKAIGKRLGKDFIVRVREPFTVYPRLLESGRMVWYYQTYDEEGRRTNPRSTGRTNRSAARAYCFELLKLGRLNKRKVCLFSEFIEHFWDYDKCDYVQARLARGQRISKYHVYIQRKLLDKYILPTFGEMHLDKIATPFIEKWIFGLKAQGLSHSSVNHILNHIKIILEEATRKELILINPAAEVKDLAKNYVARGILELKKVRTLLRSPESANYWPNRYLLVANLLAASTGMRLGEVQALSADCVFDDHVVVKQSWEGTYGIEDTKTGESRVIPTPTIVSLYLKSLKDEHPSGYVFSYDGGATPIHERIIEEALYSALEEIGITESVRKERRISFHSWRHFCNTYFRAQGINDSKVQQIMDHATQEMTERYTNFALSDFLDIIEKQEDMMKC
jgi:integrase